MSNSCLCPGAPQTYFSTLLARRLSPVQHRRASVKKRRIENTTVCDTFPTESMLMAVGRLERRQNSHATWRHVWVVIRGVTRQETHNMKRAPEPRKATDAQKEEACNNSVVSRLQRLFMRSVIKQPSVNHVKDVSNTSAAAHMDTERGRCTRGPCVHRRAHNEAQKRRGQGASVRTTFETRRLYNRACGDPGDTCACACRAC